MQFSITDMAVFNSAVGVTGTTWELHGNDTYTDLLESTINDPINILMWTILTKKIRDNYYCRCKIHSDSLGRTNESKWFSVTPSEATHISKVAVGRVVVGALAFDDGDSGSYKDLW